MVPKNTIKTVLILLLFANETSGLIEDKSAQFMALFQGRDQLLLAFVSIFLIGILRYIVTKFRICIPYALFAVLIGVGGGIACLYIPGGEKFHKAADYFSFQMIPIYLPIILFNTAFCLDIHAFFKALPQIFIVSVPQNIMAILLVGLIMRFLIDLEWTLAEAVIFGIIMGSIYPIECLMLCKMTGSPHMKQASVLLEGETIIGTTCTLFLYEIVHCWTSQWITQWYHIFSGVIRLFVLGIPIGYLHGLLGTALMRISYNDIVVLTTLTLAQCYMSFTVGEILFDVGTMSTTITGIMMAMERVALPIETDQFVYDMWIIIGGITNIIVYVAIGFSVSGALQTNYRNILFAMVTYLLCNVARFLSFIIFYPLLKRLGYGLSFSNMLLCVWMGLRSPLNLNLWQWMITIIPEFKESQVGFHVLVVYILYLAINGSFLTCVLKLSGKLEISILRQINMNNCFKYILQARERTIAVLKMDRFLSDANWPLVLKKTLMKHPYKVTSNLTQIENEEEDEEFLAGHKTTTCPDCKRNLQSDVTAKEFRDMTREAKMRILKLKKIFYSRQFENGMISKEGVRNLHLAVENAIDTEEAVMDMGDLYKLFNKEGFFFRFIRDRFIYFLQPIEDNTRPPRKYWKRICFRVVRSVAFKVFMYVVIICSVISINCSFILFPAPKSLAFDIIFNINATVFVLLLMEFWLKIFSYSWLFIFSHGFKYYFRSWWNITDFTVLCFTLLDLILNIILMFVPELYIKNYYKAILYVVLSFRILIISRFLQLFSLCKNAYPTIVKYFDSKIDKYRAMAYELGTNYLTGEKEILENLNHIIEDVKVREVVRRTIHKDRLVLTKVIGVAQKDRPRIVSSVTTKLVMRTVLNSLREDITDLKQAGWIDEYENTHLLESLSERYRQIGRIKFVQPPSAKQIFKEISWMGGNEQIINFLYDNVTSKKFEQDETVCSVGETVEGVYLLITGLLMETYEPRTIVLERLNLTGVLPIVDYVSSTQYDESISDYIVTGNCVGELSTLTQRPYDCTITAEALSQVFVIKREILKQAMEMDSNPIHGLECRLWKTVSFRIAVPIMMNIPAYRSFTQEQIKYTLERSFVPNLSNYKVFVVNEMMNEVILIEGEVVDFNTRDVYTGPCYMPRSVQKFILPRGGSLDIKVEVETKLLIVPAKGFDAYDIMLEEENTCELVDPNSTNCLRDLIKQMKHRSRASITGFKKGRKKISRKFEDAVADSKSNITQVSSGPQSAVISLDDEITSNKTNKSIKPKHTD